MFRQAGQMWRYLRRVFNQHLFNVFVCCAPPQKGNTAQILIPELIQLKGFQLELKTPTNRLKSYREIVCFFQHVHPIEKTAWLLPSASWWNQLVDPRSSPLPLPNRDLAPERSRGVFFSWKRVLATSVRRKQITKCCVPSLKKANSSPLKNGSSPNKNEAFSKFPTIDSGLCSFTGG